jgi:hypothetical protein
MAAIIAWENYRARLNVTLGVEGHALYASRDAGCGTRDA